MAKSKKAASEESEGTQMLNTNPVVPIINAIAELPQAERIKLYYLLYPVISIDQSYFGQGIDAGRDEYDKLINAYENA